MFVFVLVVGVLPSCRSSFVSRSLHFISRCVSDCHRYLVFMSVDIIVKCFEMVVPWHFIASDTHQFSIHFVYHFYCLRIHIHIHKHSPCLVIVDFWSRIASNRWLNHWTHSALSMWNATTLTWGSARFTGKYEMKTKSHEILQIILVPKMKKKGETKRTTDIRSLNNWWGLGWNFNNSNKTKRNK